MRYSRCKSTTTVHKLYSITGSVTYHNRVMLREQTTWMMGRQVLFFGSAVIALPWLQSGKISQSI